MAESKPDVVPLPDYLLAWLQKLKPEDTAVNAHKISEELWLDLKERAANVFYESSHEEKNNLMSRQMGLGMSKEETFEEKVDEDNEVWRIVQAMCVTERTKGRQSAPTMTLYGPNGPMGSLTVHPKTGAVKPLVQKCAVCGVHSTLKCGGCKMVYYCGKEHQTLHWKSGHKNVCKSFA
jgi:hypothetical protein